VAAHEAVAGASPAAPKSAVTVLVAMGVEKGVNEI
jgi:hypothetical protein